VRRELDAIKPVFMLAEAATRDLHFEAFEASYGWSLHSGLHEVATKGASVDALAGYYSEQDNLFPRGSMRLVFTSNHDKNSWEGTEFEMFGPAVEAAIVLTFTGDGLPMIYNGQEAGNTKRLQFFEKDPIAWRAHPHEALFRSLNALKAATPAIWNGPWGARMVRTANSSPQRVLSFVREHQPGARDGLGGALSPSKVLAVFNFSAEPRSVTLPEALAHGEYREPLSAQPALARRVDAATAIDLPAWGWRVFTR
jgi:glycosidase